jgi:hypothetical protein
MSHKYQRGKSYVSRNQDEIDRLTKQYTERGDFSYSPERDQAFKDYAKMMRDQGSLAMQDTIGKATASTGGYGNSYAQTAGQQVYNDYLNEIGAAESAFYDRAFDRYNAEGNNILAKRSFLQEQEAADQAAWNAAYAEDNYAGNPMTDEQNAKLLELYKNGDQKAVDTFLDALTMQGFDTTNAGVKAQEWIGTGDLFGKLDENGNYVAPTYTDNFVADSKNSSGLYAGLTGLAATGGLAGIAGLGALLGLGANDEDGATTAFATDDAGNQIIKGLSANPKKNENFHIKGGSGHENWDLEIKGEVSIPALNAEAQKSATPRVIFHENALYLLKDGKVYALKAQTTWNKEEDYDTLVRMMKGV